MTTPAERGLPVLPERVLDLLAKHGGWAATLDYIVDLERQNALSARPLPSDWVAVPREPTDDMLEAYQEAMCGLRNMTSVDDNELVVLWNAMLAAAPSAPAEGGGDGMLPDALVPHAKEWYRLCERRFSVERMTISGKLAEAIVEAICAKPAPNPPQPSASVGVLLDAIYSDLQALGGLRGLDHLHPEISVGLKLGTIRAIESALTTAAAGGGVDYKSKLQAMHRRAQKAESELAHWKLWANVGWGFKFDKISSAVNDLGRLTASFRAIEKLRRTRRLSEDAAMTATGGTMDPTHSE